MKMPSYINFEGGIILTDFYSNEFNCFVSLNSKWSQKLTLIDMQEISWSSIIRSLKTASLLVSGRHHAIYAVCKAKVTFIAMKGNTHKIKSLIITAKTNINVYSNFKDIQNVIDENLLPYEEYEKLFDWMEG